jgi:alkylation response protein AidB-like acyl-CoA dehydrogenase
MTWLKISPKPASHAQPRIGTAVQGLAASEGSFQGALTYAKDRYFYNIILHSS